MDVILKRKKDFNNLPIGKHIKKMRLKNRDKYYGIDLFPDCEIIFKSNSSY